MKAILPKISNPNEFVNIRHVDHGIIDGYFVDEYFFKGKIYKNYVDVDKANKSCVNATAYRYLEAVDFLVKHDLNLPAYKEIEADFDAQ